MIFVYFIVAITLVIVLNGIFDQILEEKVKNGLLENYYIGKYTNGGYYIYGKSLWAKGSPKKFIDVTFKTEELAEEALKEFMREQLRLEESESFSKKLSTEDARDSLRQEMIDRSLREVLAMQDRFHEEQMANLQEKRRIAEGTLPTAEKAKEILDAPPKRTRIKV